MTNQQWLLERQLKTAEILTDHENRIAAIEEGRKQRSFFIGTVAQIVIALCAIAALAVSVFK